MLKYKYIHKMLDIKKLLIAIFLFTICTIDNLLLSQVNNLGFPEVINYSREEYRAGTQNWESSCLKQGQILFSNNEGLLIFDGIGWKLHETPNKTILRSLEISKNSDRIWVGGQDEIGYFDYADGQFEFIDLKNMIPKEFSSLDDVWEIVELKEKVYFRSRNKIFQLGEDEVNIFPSEGSITFLASFQERIFYNEWDKGLFTIDENNEKQFVDGSENMAKKAIVDIVAINDQEALLITSSNGLFLFNGQTIKKWETQAESYLVKNRVISAAFHSDLKHLYLGTEIGGIISFNMEGRVELLLNKQAGLQNNTVTTITIDNNGNLWLGTYNGIDKISLSNANGRIYPDGDLEGALYDILEWKDHYYFGTNNGLYKLKKRDYYNPLKETKFDLIKNSEGQVWGLDIIDDRLYMGHNHGAFEILENGSAKEISPLIGAWRFEKLMPNLMIVGTYAGLDLFEKKGAEWNFVKRYPGFQESSRIMYLDKEGYLWVSHPYKGLFKIQFKNDFQDIEIDTIGKKDGIANFENCYVHEIDDLIFVSTDDHIYKYDYDLKSFDIDEKFMSFFKGHNFRRFIESKNGLWYITDKECGTIKMNNSGLDLKLKKEIFLNGEMPFVGGFENLFPLSANEAFLCTNKGVIHKSIFDSSINNNLSVNLKKITLSDGIRDSILYTGFSTIPDRSEVDFEFNDLRFDFVSELIEGKSRNVKYSFKLDGFEDHWSNWSNIRFKEYTNLPHGEYTFLVKARKEGIESGEIEAYSFEIKPPWFATWLMKVVYLILAGLIILLLVTLPNRRIKKEKEIILTQKKETEEKVQDLENEKLQSEIKYKNNELANLTMHLLQKSETLKQIQTEIENVRKNIKDPAAKKELKKVFSLLNSDNRLEEDWQNFSYHFDKVHHDFLKRIKEEYPKLSSTDLKLCAYLRLNLTTKEIAPLLNISTRGVEISRYRLRKKLALTSDVNLNSFMISY